MKYGVHSYIFTDRWADDKLDILDTVKELGLNCFEIGVGDDVPFTVELTRHKAETLGLELLIGPGGEWPIECDLSSDSPADRKRGLAWHKKQVDLANRLEAVAYCGALYGHPGVVKRRRPPTDEYERTAESLHRLAEYGEQNGVKIALESMSHFRTHMVNKPEQLMALIAKASHPNLYVLLDTYHMITEVRDYAQAIRTVRDRLWAIHACENDRGVPGGGLVPWDAVFETLDEIDFQGYIIFESYNSSIGDFAYQRGMFHNVCPDGITFVREALEFVRRGLESQTKRIEARSNRTRRQPMPQLTVELTWREWEYLEAVAQSEEISLEEVVRRALDTYLAQEHVKKLQAQDDSVAATRDHLVGPDEVMDLDL